MFYRRKIFLALLESSGESLSSLDFQNLLFLYCKASGENHYDFFPGSTGCCSYIFLLDKEVLIKEGLLKDNSVLRLSSINNFIGELEEADKKQLKEFSRSWKNLRGDPLLKETFMRYPECAVKSEDAEKIMGIENLLKAKQFFNFSDEPVLFTAGYEGITIDEYINRLLLNNISLVADVRKNPLSMKYGFSKTKLKKFLEGAGVSYVHLPELGIPSNQRKELSSSEDYEKLFEKYAAEILPENIESINKILELFKEYGRVCLTCFEADYKSCHRNKITEYLLKHSFKGKIVHM